MAETTRFGLEKVGGSYGGSIADSGGKYTTTDRDTIDKLLAFFENHKHDGGSNPQALASPTVAASAAVHATGGTIANGTTRYYKYSLIDQFGLETAASPELVVTMPASIEVTDSPVVTGATGVGSALAEDTYYYALTGNTAGGQTTLGPETVITIQTGQNQANVVLPALPSGITSWNLWRMAVADQGWTKVAASHAPGSFSDVGFATADCLCDPTTQPPTLDLAPTGSGSVTITPDPSALGSAVSWRLYESDTSGFYDSTSLVASVVPTVVGNPPPASYLDTGAALLAGQPLLVPTTIKPSHAVAGGGSGGGGADSHYVTDLASVAVPASGVQTPVYVGTPSVSSAGYDLTLIYQPNGDSYGDEIQVNKAAVYAPFMRVKVEGLTPGDVVTGFIDQIAFGAPVTNFFGNNGQLVCPPGATSVDGMIALPARYMAFGTRLAFSFKVNFAGSAPSAVHVGIGVSMTSGSPLSAELYPAPAGFGSTNPADGEIDVSWTDRAGDTGYDVVRYVGTVYGEAISGGSSTSTESFTGLTDGVANEFVLLAKNTIAGVQVYSTPSLLSATPAAPPGPWGDDFNRANGPLTSPPYTLSGPTGGSLAVVSNQLENSGTAGPSFALRNMGAVDKQITFTHYAIAGPPLIVYLAAQPAGGNPQVQLSLDGSVTAPVIDYYDSGGTHTAINMTAVGAGGTSYQGSSAAIDCRLAGRQVDVYQGGTHVWTATIPASPAGATACGVGIFHDAGSGLTKIDDLVCTNAPVGEVSNVVVTPAAPDVSFTFVAAGGPVDYYHCMLRTAGGSSIDFLNVPTTGPLSGTFSGEVTGGTSYKIGIVAVALTGPDGPEVDTTFTA